MAHTFCDSLHSIPKLEGGANYDAWKLLVSASLQSSGSWKFVDNTAVVPTKEADEKEYQFVARLESFNAQAALARMIILSSCKPHIQTSLTHVLTAKACWEKLQQQFQPRGIIQKHDYWRHFVKLQYQGEEMEDFSVRYLEAVDRCLSAGITIDQEVQIMQFLFILDPHPNFQHWAANIRNQMRRDPLNTPSLDLVLQEAKDEWWSQQSREYPTLQINMSRPQTQLRSSQSRSSVTALRCKFCNFTGHNEDMCFYKHIHLRPSGWQPNPQVMHRIQERLKGTMQVQTSLKNQASSSSSPFLDVFTFTQYSHQVHTEATNHLTKTTWISDSGANHHFCNDRTVFRNYIEDPLTINTGAGSVVSPGYGDISLSLLRSDDSVRSINLQQVRYMPTSLLNTMSEHLLELRGVFWHGWQSKFVFQETGEEFAIAHKVDGLKVLTVRLPVLPVSQLATTNQSALTLSTIHRRFAHLHLDGIKHLIQKEGLVVIDPNNQDACVACELAKSKRSICRVSHSPVSRPFERIHMDLVGPIATLGLGLTRYFLLITDDFSRFRWVSSLKNKG